MSFQRLGGGFQDEHQRGDLHVSLLLLEHRVLLFAECFQLGGIGFVELGDMRNHDPVAVQVRTGDLLDAGQLDLFHITELAEVYFRPRQYAQTVTTGYAGRGRSGLGTLDGILHVGLHVFFDDAALATGGFHLGQVDAELARQTAYCRRGVHVRRRWQRNRSQRQ